MPPESVDRILNGRDIPGRGTQPPLLLGPAGPQSSFDPHQHWRRAGGGGPLAGLRLRLATPSWKPQGGRAFLQPSDFFYSKATSTGNFALSTHPRGRHCEQQL